MKTTVNRVTAMLSPQSGKPVANQFVIEGTTLINGKPCRSETFQSYKSVIAIKIFTPDGMKTYLDETYWNWSVTTAKYRREFLGEGVDDIRAKIEDGTYILTDLNTEV